MGAAPAFTSVSEAMDMVQAGLSYRHDRTRQCPDYVPGISQPPSTYSLTTRDLTSQRSG